MLELTEQNAAEILHARGHLPSIKDIRARELSGGVSNAVFQIFTPTGSFVVKQARGKLRVQADWQCSVERIWREVDVLEACHLLLQREPKFVHGNFVRVPEVKWIDRELYAYAMTAAAANCRTWKEDLLAGRSQLKVAQFTGSLLGRLHAESWAQADLAARFRDRTFFAQLRLEPYYLVAAEKYRPLATQLGDLVDQTWRERHALVHGDFSPKNLLVSHDGLMLIDFEVGHYGDPAFDLGFCLTHLTLKGIHLPERRDFMLDAIRHFWIIYSGTIESRVAQSEIQQLESRTIQHLAGCLVARVHGKSPVDYLKPPEQLRAVQLAEQLFALGPAATWQETFALLEREI